jgi:PhnB protein
MPPGSDDKIMHASLRIGETVVNAADGHCGGKPKFEGFALTLVLDDAAQAQRFFAALSDGGQVQMPLTKTFFSPSFGMVADRFGVLWMMYVKQ